MDDVEQTDVDATSASESEPIELSPAAIAIAQNYGVETKDGADDQEGTLIDQQLDQQDADRTQPNKDVSTGGSKDAAIASGKSWVNDEAKNLAASYGLDETTLQDFSSREELDRFARIQDKLLMSAGKPQAAPATSPTGQEPAAGMQTAAAGNPQTQTTGQISLNPEDWAKEGYDEKTVGLVRAFSEQQANFQQVQQYIAQQQQIQHINTFHDVVDQLDDKRFGKSMVNGVATPVPEAQSAERQKVYNAAAELEAGIRARAEKLGIAPQVPPLNELIRRAYNAVYGDELRANAQKSVTQKILAQSKGRRPVASTRSSAPVPVSPPKENETQMEAAARIAASPLLSKKFQELQRENGAAV